MSMSDVDFLNLTHVCAFGIRKMLLKTEKRNWEVYARLTSGSSFAMMENLSHKKAKTELMRLAKTVMESSPISFVRAKDDEDLIPMGKVARVYVDSQVDYHVVMVEDTSGTSYLIRTGSKEQCEQDVKELTQSIVMNQMEIGGA